MDRKRVRAKPKHYTIMLDGDDYGCLLLRDGKENKNSLKVRKIIDEAASLLGTKVEYIETNHRECETCMENEEFTR